MPTLFINGKYTAQPLTGVQRYASELVQALDRDPAAWAGWRIELLCPPGAALPALRHVQPRHLAGPGLPLHLWEQAVLPLAARGGLLLNLAGSAPLLAHRQWCTFHDAAVFDHPRAYSWRFVRWYRFHFRWLARRAERILTVSGHARARLALRLGLAPQAIAVVPDGADHLQAVPADTTVLDRLALRGRRWLLAVGSRNPTKNLPALLRAWGRVPHGPDTVLVLVGGTDAAVFAAQAQPVAASAVIAAGRVDDGALRALYEGALALVFPSLDEGFGLPPLEAMALGCPVVAARAGALPEVCGDAALYVDPRDDDSIAAAIERVLAEPALRADLARRGAAHAAGWGWQAAAQRLAALLRQAAATPAGAGA